MLSIELKFTYPIQNQIKEVTKSVLQIQRKPPLLSQLAVSDPGFLTFSTIGRVSDLFEKDIFERELLFWFNT